MFLPCVLWLFCSVFCLGVLRVFVFWLAVLFWNWHYFEVIFAPLSNLKEGYSECIC